MNLAGSFDRSKEVPLHFYNYNEIQCIPANRDLQTKFTKRVTNFSLSILRKTRH